MMTTNTMTNIIINNKFIKSNINSYINPLYPIIKNILEDWILNSYVNKNISMDIKEKIISSNPSVLCCLAYPHNNLNKLFASGIYFYWSLVFDYIISRHDNPNIIRNQILNVLDNKLFDEQNSLCLILKEIFNRMEFTPTTDFNFRNAIRLVINKIIDGNCSPEKYLNLNKEDYLSFRHYDFYSPCMIVLCEIPLDASIDSNLYKDEEFNEFIILASKYTFYVNDIVSYNYEKKDKSDVNMKNINIINVYTKNNLSIEESLDKSLKDFYEIEKEFLKQCDEILIKYSSHFNQLYKFIENLKLCCAGVFMWHMISPRYKDNNSIIKIKKILNCKNMIFNF